VHVVATLAAMLVEVRLALVHMHMIRVHTWTAPLGRPVCNRTWTAPLNSQSSKQHVSKLNN
jgi:hypothetical protein